MLFDLLWIILAFTIARTVGLGQVEICRFVCPDVLDNSPLNGEVLNADGSVFNCFWFETGIGLHETSFDANGDVIPGTQSDNVDLSLKASEHCALVTDGWEYAEGQVCILDRVTPRILDRDRMVSLSSNSPVACTAACDALGFTFAGVEFGSECHCGVGFNQNETIVPLFHTVCDTVCTGNSSETCGAPGFIEIFQGPTPPRAAQLPAGWSIFSSAPCAQDSPSRMFTDTLIAGSILAATDTPASCVAFCIQNGFTMAGVEGGDECYCGTEFRDTPLALDPSECNLPCQGAPGVSCGGHFAIQLYTSS